MDITALYNISSGAVKEMAGQNIAGSSVIRTPESEEFASVLSVPMDKLNTTNAYLSEKVSEHG